jgi:Tfp pilus assembly protein PilX
MGKLKQNERGFTLIAALLVSLLLSAMAVGLIFLVTNEGHASANEQESNVAFNAAESGIEKLTADLGALYNSSLSPLPSDIQNLTSYPPTGLGANYTETITYATDASGNPVSSWRPVSAGSNQGLYAEVVPMTLNVSATRSTGASVNISRTVEVALIPVFQFGVFCGYDCSYFPGPDFSFGGRVHTNGNLFLADGAHLVFNDKIAAYSQVIMDQLENGHPTSSGYGGTVYVSTAAGGCPLNTFPPSGSNCVALPVSTPSAPGDASYSGGYPGIGGSKNPNFPSISGGALKTYVTNGITGATNMQLPFVQNSCTSNPPPCTDPIQIIRKPLAGESNLSSIGQSRVYNKSQIRVLLADSEADLYPGVKLGDPDNILFTTTLTSGAASSIAITTAGIAYSSTSSYPTYVANTAVTGTQFYGMADPTKDVNWKVPINPVTGVKYANWKTWPLLGELTTNPPDVSAGGQGAWLRVEYLNNQDKWIGITREWLGWGFGRSYGVVPTTPGPLTLTKPTATNNQVNPHAILILQQLSPTAKTPVGSANNWYPVNFYDTREGEPRDDSTIGCTANGIMNAVEIDVGNLAQWLARQGVYNGGSGNLVNYADQNGYLLYFSDRRGMLPNPNQGNITSGEAGLEDVVNSGISSGTPDGKLEPINYYKYSSEDADQNGKLDNWGGANIGYGFGVNTFSVPPNPYAAVACSTIGAANAVSGARHVLKLVDGGMDSLGRTYLPLRTDTPTPSGGFTVASENPVYVQGNYNSALSDPYWTSNFTNSTTQHAAAAIIADTVTLLSNQWSDVNSLANPAAPGNRVSTGDAYYRMAVAGGKNVPFPQPSWGGQDMGTDGGLHNFLRYLEDWGKNGTSLHYNGSLVSMYYSEYDTGIFKCCATVYAPPKRDYHFDVLFLNPVNLPPGTPMFQDIVNLSYQQNFTPQ